MKPTGTKNKVFGYLASRLIFFVLSEVVLRVCLLHFADEPRFKTYASGEMIQNRYSEARLILHDSLFYVTNPKFAYGPNKHNEQGFRGEEIERNSNQTKIRIACLGGSTTYSDGVKDYKESYPFLLQSFLGEMGQKVEVINAGVPGYNSLQNLKNYELRIKHLEPDYIVLYQGINDLQNRLVWPPEAFQDRPTVSSTPKKHRSTPLWSSISCIRVPLVMLKLIESQTSLEAIIEVPDTYVGDEYRTQLMSGNYPTDLFKEVSIDSILTINTARYFEINTRQLIVAAEQAGSKVVLVTFVYSSDFEDIAPKLSRPEFQERLVEHNDIMRSLSEEFSLDLINLANTFEARPELFTNGIHFNAEGNRQRSRQMAIVLQNIISHQETLEAHYR